MVRRLLNHGLVFWGTFFPGLDGFEEARDLDVDTFYIYVLDVAAFIEAGPKSGELVLCTGKIKHVGSTYVDQMGVFEGLGAQRPRT